MFILVSCSILYFAFCTFCFCIKTRKGETRTDKISAKQEEKKKKLNFSVLLLPNYFN